MDRLTGASLPSSEQRPAPGRAPQAGGLGAATQQAERVATRREPPNGSDFCAEDSYADHVVNLGSRYALTSEDIARARQAIHRSVITSVTRLADPQTAIAIRQTLLDALDCSPTFRHVVSYGVQGGQCPLAHLSYINQYAMTPMFANFMRIDQLRFRNIDADHPDGRPIDITPWTEHVEGSDARTINVGVAPDPATRDMPSWQQGLIHEIMHAITEARDPQDNPDMRIGPTEILARLVASEMGWRVPEFASYADPARTRHLTQRNLRALEDAIARHQQREPSFFLRLATIANSDASPDFGELHADNNLLSELRRAPVIAADTAAPLPVFLADPPASRQVTLTPSSAADAYAEHILRSGARRPLTHQEISTLRVDLRQIGRAHV